MASKNTSFGPNATDYWDISPFTTAPAIQESASAAYGGHHIITIPDSSYPSPLIEDITPQSLKTLHDTLTAGNSASGHEVWKAWKRAWDLWNNHYIEGRANPSWIQEELRRRKEERSKIKQRRSKYPSPQPQRVPKIHGVFDGQKEELAIPARGRKWVRARASATVLIQDGTEKKKTGATKTVTREVLKQRSKKGKNGTQQTPQVKEIQQVKVTRKVPYYPIQPWGATVKARQRTGHAVPALSEDVIQPEDRRTVNTRSKAKSIAMEPQVLDYMRASKDNLTTWNDLSNMRIEGKSLEVKPDRTKTIGKKTTDEVWQSVMVSATAAADADVEWYEATEAVDVDVLEDADRFVAVSVPRWELVDDLDDPASQFRAKKQTIDGGKRKMVESVEDEDIEDVQSDVESMSESSFDEVEEDEWIHNYGDEVVDVDNDEIIEGCSGGFVAMKCSLGNEESGFGDSVANTVWRPIWVGEEDSGEGCALLDNLWNEQRMRIYDGGRALREPGLLEKDGGVDAGGGPFTCMRWMYKYVRRGKGSYATYRKRKVWDEVTGTVFNMPMVPYDRSVTNKESLSSPAKPELDTHSNISCLLHTSSLPATENDYERNNIFPLDIRRLQLVKASETDRTGHGCQLTLEGETLVTTRYNNPKRTFRSTLTNPTDPWYVTEEQEGHRDVPARHWPLFPNNESSDLLPFDETHYLTHRMRDRLGEAAYFVTNLFGGTLLINGQAIRKGQIAGPLPKFAVIETPGGQVSFWWGEHGRGYGEEGVQAGEAHWEILRRNRGWEHLGKSAGQVWDERIIDRLKREDKGEGVEEEDDGEWEYYRTWKEKEDVDEGMKKDAGTVGNLTEGKDYFAEPQVVIVVDPKVRSNDATDFKEPDNSNLILAPEQFASAEQELKYLAIEHSLIEAAVNTQVDQPVIPLRSESWWQGPVEMGHCENQERVRQVTVNETWKAWRSTFIERQKEWHAQIATLAQGEKDLILQRGVETRRKRKAMNDGGQHLKRPHVRSALALQRQSEVAEAGLMLQGISTRRKKDAKDWRELQAKEMRKQLEKKAQMTDLKRKGKSKNNKKIIMEWEAQREVDEQILHDKENANANRNLGGLPALSSSSDVAVETEALLKKLAGSRMKKEQEVFRVNLAAVVQIQKDEAAATLQKADKTMQAEISNRQEEAEKLKNQAGDLQQTKAGKAERDKIGTMKKLQEEQKPKDDKAAETKANEEALEAALNEAVMKEAMQKDSKTKNAQHANLVRILKSLKVSDILIARIMSLLEVPLYSSPSNKKFSDWSQVDDVLKDNIALYRGLFDTVGELRMATFNLENKSELSSQYQKKFAQYTNDLRKMSSPSMPPTEEKRKADLEAAMEAQAIVDGITPEEMYMEKGCNNFKEWYAGVEEEDSKFFQPQRENPEHHSSAKKQANSNMRFYAREQARLGVKIRADLEYNGDQAACLKGRYNCKTEEEYLQWCFSKLVTLAGMPPRLEKPAKKEGNLTKAEEAQYKTEKAKFEAMSKIRGLLHNAEKDRYDYNTRTISEEIRDSEAAYLASCQPPKTTTKEGMTSREI